MKEKFERFMLKTPFGIISGAAGMAAFFCGIGFTAAYLLFSAIAGQTNDKASPFENWWQVLLLAAAIIFAAAAIASLTLYVIKKVKFKGGKNEAESLERTWTEA